MLIDSHCHLDFPELSENLNDVLGVMQRNGVNAAMCIGVNIEHLPRIFALAEQHQNLFATVGVHPENTEGKDPSVVELINLGSHPRVLAIGETGLDYYWHKDAPEWQRARFSRHIHAAIALNKPLVVHNREATADTLRILREEGASKVGGIMHCFTESWAVAQEVIDLGFYISLSGIVTFKNAALVREVARNVPLNRLLVETDSPYLAPVPYRGKLNQPGYVKHVAQMIADLREISFEDVAKATTDNFLRLFPNCKIEAMQ